MKKVLSLLGLIAILSMATPVFASPAEHGPNGYRAHGMQTHYYGGGYKGHERISYHYNRPHYREPVVYRSYPRLGGWYGCGHAYRDCYWLNPRLGWYDGYYMPLRYHRPLNSIGVNISF